MTRNRALNTALIAVAVAAIIISALVLVLALTNSDDEAAATPESVAAEVGCDNPQPAETEELFVTDAYTCAGGGRVLWFNSSDARDSFEEIAAGFGSEFPEKGELWLYEAP